MLHIKLDEIKGETINEGQYERQIKLISSKNSNIKRDLYTVGVSIVNPNKIHEEHFHKDNQEIVIVIAGRGKALVANTQFEISEGSIINIEKNEPHSFINTGTEDLKLLWIYDPQVEDEKILKK